LEHIREAETVGNRDRPMGGSVINSKAEPVAASDSFRDLTPAQWRAFFAAFLGWLLDGFDFSILTFLLLDVQHSFTIDKALAGALGTGTLIFRLVGGLGVGTAADRFGRKPMLVLSILWISLFSLLSGLSINYAMLFAFRALFGIGMGGVWAAGLPLALEHWPRKLRGVASGLLMGGFMWGYVLAAVVFQLLYPLLDKHMHSAWRVLFCVVALPVFIVFWIQSRVKESPVWLARRERLPGAGSPEKLSMVRIFQVDLVGTTLQTSVLMAVFMVSYYSIIFWYPTFIREALLSPVRYVVALNIGGIIGSAAWGQASETKLGRRGAIAISALLGVSLIPIFVGPPTPARLLVGALLMGACGIGAWGMAPSYLAERFPTAVRAVGPGFAYHAGAAVGSLTPVLIGTLQDRGVKLPTAMAACILGAGLAIAGMVWLGPETRGRELSPSDL
jgi:MFS transporter, SHS family, lactate transporter